eukprot:1160416-Pelagomonas_calceolata.AAC.2
MAPASMPATTSVGLQGAPSCRRSNEAANMTPHATALAMPAQLCCSFPVRAHTCVCMCVCVMGEFFSSMNGTR